MASQEESKLLSRQQAANNKTHHQNGSHHHHHQKESSEKMNEKPISESQEEEKEGKSFKNEAKDSVAASTVRVCDFCGKEFNSGKALGGHRRYHIQALKKMEAQKKNQQPPSPSPSPSNQYTLRIKYANGNFNNNNNNNNNNSPPPPPCSSSRSFRCIVCEKYFPSEKALYGHMRSHPERDWRGMNPPFPSSSSSEEEDNEIKDNHNNGLCSSSDGLTEEGGLLCSSSSSDGLFADLSLSCAGSSWLKKDKRGRQSIGAAEAAENLVFMCHVGGYLTRLRFPPTPPPPQGEEEDQEVVQLLPVKKRKKNSSGSSSSPPDWKEKLLEGSDDDDDDGSLEGENHEWRMTVMSLMTEEKVIKMNKKEKVLEKMVKSKGEDQSVIKTLKPEVVMKSSPKPPPQKYVCDICGKSFNLFQALGGHKSKHNKANHKKGKEVVVEQEPEEEVKACINEEEGEASLICSEERLVISLNGNDKINMSNEGEEEEVREAGHQSGGSKMKDIDLNVTYVMENED